MLVGVAVAPAVMLEEGEVGGVGDDAEGEGTVHFEPLGAFAPLMEVDYGPHAAGVAAAADGAELIVDFDEGFGGIDEVGVGGGEVEKWDSGF